MTPDFTLSLSFEGIRLLHRVDGGWQSVGDVALDVPDLSGSLASLRAAGAALAGDQPFATKLLIPDDQIKFAQIETARTTLDDVHAAIDGSTPYAIGDLMIDYEQSGGRTHIAAVARETLAEAEAFAAEHGFNPLAFVAAAEPFTFQQEVFFGTTAHAADANVTRDDLPVRLSEVQPPPIVDAPAPAAVEEVTAEPEVEPEIAAAPEAEATPEPTPEVEAEAEPTSEPDPEPDDDAFDAVAETAAELEIEEQAHDAIPPDDTLPEPEPEPEPTVMFASRARAGFTATEPAVEVHPIPDGDPEPMIEPLFTRRKEPPALAAPVDVADSPALNVAEPHEPDVVPAPETYDSAPFVEAPTLGSAAEPVPEDADYTPVGAVPVASAPQVDPVPDAAATDTAPEAEKMAVFGSAERQRGKPRLLALKLTAALLLIMFLVALWANTWTEEGIAGWFSSDEPVTEVAAVTEVVTAPTTPAVASAPAPVAAPAPSALTPEIDQPVSSDAIPLPVVRAPTGRILTPAQADRIYAATGVYQRAPRFAVEPRIGALDGLRESAIVIAAPRPDRAVLPPTDALFTDLPIATPLNPPAPGTNFQRDLRGFILATPDGVVTPDGALVIAGQPARVPPLRPGTVVVSAPDPGAVVADNGEPLVLIPGPPPLSPPPRPSDLVPDVIAEVPAGVTQPTDDVLAAISSAVAEGLTDAGNSDNADATTEAPTDLAPNGSLAALTDPATEPVTPEAEAEAPVEEGLNVVAGAPPLAPPLRPQDLAPDEALATDVPPEDIVVVAGPPPRQPPARPETVVARAAQVSAGAIDLASLQPDAAPAAPYADPALAGFRPSGRPADFDPVIAEVEEAPETPSIADVVGAIAEAAPPSAFVDVTARAVSVSERPDSRPRNFNRVVAAAQARIAQQQQQAQAQAQAASTQSPAAVAPTRAAPAQQVSNRPAQPTGSVPTTVARAATIDNAIRLSDVNLIGVYGRPNDRRALVRLSNGRFVKVEVGSALDGGRVTAIGDSALNYTKRGRTYALQLPQG